MNLIKVYFIRHGQTKFNLLNRIQGSSDIKLTKEGIVQAINCNLDKNINFDIGYHSSLSRSKDTLDIICKGLIKKPKIVCNDLIIERSYGIFEGLTENEIKNKYTDLYFRWIEDENTEIKNAETIDNVLNRINKFLNLLVINKFKNVLVVTHSGILYTLFKYVTDTKFSSRPNIKFNNCSVQILDIFYLNNKIINLHFHIGDHTYIHRSSPTK